MVVPPSFYLNAFGGADVFRVKAAIYRLKRLAKACIKRLLSACATIMALQILMFSSAEALA